MLAIAAAPAAAVPPAPLVVVDPGHDLRANLATEPIGPGSTVRKIRDGGGTRGLRSNTTEAELTLAISLRLARLLRRAGLRVALTRVRTAGTSAGNVARAHLANRAQAALFLRVHADGAADAATRGTASLYPARTPGWTDDVFAASRRAAVLLHRELVRGLRFPDRGVQQRPDLTGFNWADVPVVLVEVGFMTNPVEDLLLATPRWRQRAALALCRGTLRFLHRPPRACAP